MSHLALKARKCSIIIEVKSEFGSAKETTSAFCVSLDLTLSPMFLYIMQACMDLTFINECLYTCSRGFRNVSLTLENSKN